MKKGIFAGIALSAAAAIALVTAINCDDGGGNSCAEYCQRYGECLEEEYSYLYEYYDENWEWTDELQEDCVDECHDSVHDANDPDERKEIMCQLNCRKESDCDDFFECVWDDCDGYDYYYYYD